MPDPVSAARERVLKPLFDDVPRELQALAKWGLWKYELNKDDKLTKVPYRTHSPSQMASISDSKTWASFEDIRKAYEEGGFDGIMFALDEDDPYTFADLDHSLDNSGTIARRAVSAIDDIKSYTETSPSGPASTSSPEATSSGKLGVKKATSRCTTRDVSPPLPDTVEGGLKIVCMKYEFSTKKSLATAKSTVTPILPM